MAAYHIHISGQVQGVGFRPFVYKLALELGIKGWVSNTTDGVHIEVSASELIIQSFYNRLIEQPPSLAIITHHIIYNISENNFLDFKIVHSDIKGSPNLLLTPDYGICNDCRAELFDENNRRFGYPFITCTNCGPRYSIIKSLPYDRHTTTMLPFKMCAVCEPEYNNPLDRRYYSQTNSCSDCAVELFIHGKPEFKNQNEIIDLIVDNLKTGQIIAIKGIGGYLLLADTTNRETIIRLRERKHRPIKPFALMYPSKEILLGDVEMCVAEEKEYESIEAPIVIFQLKKKLQSNLQADLIAPELNQIGVMKDYTPLFALILAHIDFPIIATSANVSDSPILFNDDKASTELRAIADLIIGNTREIVVPQDDSVVRFSPQFKQRIIIRRSRGLAPNFIDKNKNCQSESTLLAMGAGLKSSLGFYHLHNTYISQYLGNINSFESQQCYELLIEHWLQLFQTKPNKIIVDKHPQYFSTVKGKELAEKFECQAIEVQHHKAHFAAILGEKGLITSSEKVLGIIWDGVGLGDDGAIWGGEFFRYQALEMKRIEYFEYFKHFAFDKFAMEPRLPAFSLAYHSKNAHDLLFEKFTETEFKNYSQLIEKENQLQTSSVGRLFDAVASLIGCGDINSFEGEAAMKLENLALQFYQTKKEDCGFYCFKKEDKLSPHIIINEIINDINNQLDKGKIALKFHYTLVEIVKFVAQKYQIEILAFSGGVFQNALLIDLLIEKLNKDFDLYFHQQLSPNDENISFGQLVYIENNLK